MDANGWGTLHSQWRELNQLDRLLELLARPARLGSGVPPTRRRELIEQVWSSKRPLLREMGAFDDPLPPCA